MGWEEELGGSGRERVGVFEVVFAPAIKVPKNVDGGDGAVICM